MVCKSPSHERESDWPTSGYLPQWRCAELFRKVVRLTQNFLEKQYLKWCCKCSKTAVQEDCWESYCWTRQSAYSSGCTCWQLPNLFFVSRRTRQMSLSVFYSNNDFVVIPAKNWRYSGLDAMLLFLRTLPMKHESISNHLIGSSHWICPALEVPIP
jgi:hypothetical protein